MKTFLDGLTAGVVGLIAATALTLLVANVRNVVSGVVFVIALALLFYWNHRLSVPTVIAGAAAVGLLAMAL
jgi:chromate transporter